VLKEFRPELGEELEIWLENLNNSPFADTLQRISDSTALIENEVLPILLEDESSLLTDTKSVLSLLRKHLERYINKLTESPPNGPLAPNQPLAPIESPISNEPLTPNEPSKSSTPLSSNGLST
jgi:hypothetical protein